MPSENEILSAEQALEYQVRKVDEAEKRLDDSDAADEREFRRRKEDRQKERDRLGYLKEGLLAAMALILENSGKTSGSIEKDPKTKKEFAVWLIKHHFGRPVTNLEMRTEGIEPAKKFGIEFADGFSGSTFDKLKKDNAIIAIKVKAKGAATWNLNKTLWAIKDQINWDVHPFAIRPEFRLKIPGIDWNLIETEVVSAESE